MNIEDNETFEALCARFLPKFNEFLMRRSKNIFSCELATSLDGINSMPALYDKDGVRKQVIAPLTLLTKNIDEEIREVTEATAAAKNAAEKAEEATRQVSSAIDSTKQLVETVNEAEATRDESENTRIANEENRKAQEETRQEQEEVRIANEENRNTGEAERQRAEVARAEAEQKRVLDYATVKAAADKATENANSMAANPPYVDRDGYYYRWNVGTQSYDKTDVNLTGKAFVIKKVFTSIAEMTATDISTFNENDFILINTANTEDEDNAKLYVVAVDSDGNKFYSYLVDMSGFRGFTGKTPQMLVGTVTSLLEDEEPAVSVTPDDVDSEGNPKYKINFGIPRGKSLKYSDLTEEQLAELKKPATDAANESEEQTALCNAATFNANDAADMSSAQTLLCKEATDAAQEVIDKFADLIAAINIEVTGDGNAIADVSQDGSKLKFTKAGFLERFEMNASSNKFDANNFNSGITFAYTETHSNVPTTGTLVSFAPKKFERYAFQLQEKYTGDSLYFRRHDGDSSTWGDWREIIHSGNIGQQTINLSQIPAEYGYNGKFVSVFSKPSSQYQQGYWKRCLQFHTTYEGFYDASITFEDHPSEMNRSMWNECNVNIRQNDIQFFKLCKVDNNRGYKCVGDGRTFSIWIYCDKNNWDGFSHIIVTQVTGVIDNVNLEPAYQDEEPVGTYSKFANVGGYVHAAESIPTRTLWGQSFNGTGDVSGTLSKVNRIEFIGGLVDGNYAMNLRNSDVIGINALIFADPSDSSNEGVVFPRLDGKYDSVWAHNGILSFTVAKSAANTEDGTRYNVVTTSGSSSSDLRLKKSIHSLDCLSIIKDMGGTVGFEWKENNEKSIGFIAQRVQKNPHMKDLVTQDYKGYLKIDYWSPKLIAVAFGGIVQVDDKVTKLKKKVSRLEKEVKHLKDELESKAQEQR